MRHKIVHTATIVTLLGGGPKNIDVIKQNLTDNSIIVAADGAANFCHEHAISPHSVIGDMDSILPQTRATLDPARFHHIAEQDSTDFDKCLRNIQAPAIVAYGFMGARLDHTLAACTALVRHPEHRCVMLSDDDLCFLAPLKFTIDLPKGTRFSLFPMDAVTGRSEGLQYAIDGLNMHPGGMIGTSNAVTGQVRLEISNRSMLVLLPSKFRDVVLDMLVCS